jgi:hypothetical protein
VDVRQHDVPTRAEHARELAQHRPERRHVGERERAHDQVDVGVRQRQRGQLALQERRLRHLRTGLGQHVRRAVHPDDPVAEAGQERAVPAGPAGRVERAARLDVRQDRPDQRLLDLEQRVVLRVVVRRPCSVAGYGVHVADLVGRAQFAAVVGCQHRADLGDPCVAEAGVGEIARVRPQQRHALHPERKRQRMPKRHGRERNAGLGEGTTQYPADTF